MAASKIEWTGRLWNPLAGCSVLSPGCTHCYAMRMAARIVRMGHTRAYDNTIKTVNGRAVWTRAIKLGGTNTLQGPLRWRKPAMIFVNSMSDLFHEAVLLTFIADVVAVIAATPRHTYQMLTKRSERLARLAPDLPWPSNLWIGVSVENRKRLARIDHLRTLPAAVRWLSIEPLLENLGCLDLAGIGWVVVGGESGPGARAMAPGWAMDIRDQCVAAGVPFIFKQHGRVHKKKAGRLLDGREWSQYLTNQ